MEKNCKYKSGGKHHFLLTILRQKTKSDQRNGLNARAQKHKTTERSANRKRAFSQFGGHFVKNQ